MSSQKRTKAKRAHHRYSVGEKKKILKIADRVGIPKAVGQTGVSSWSIYRWRNERDLKAKKSNTPEQSTPREVIKPVRIQVPAAVQKKVVGVWRHNPGFGPSQVPRQLRRVGVRCDTKTVRKILLAHGYTPPESRPPRPREDRRFEASRPLELVQMDVLQFYVHAQRVYLLLALDDHSRFITGFELLQRESMEAAMDVIEGSIRRYGKPEAVLTDRGAVFHTWSGIGRFDRLLESYGIDHVLASPEHPQTCGKVEAVNKAIQKELIRRVEFRNFLDAKEQIGRWVDEFNHQRTHQGIGGVLVPADRFYGRADRVLARIESAANGGRNGPVPPELETADEDREISLFQIRLGGDTIELWLFGRLVVRLPIEDEVS
jgi:transposase InsO family protein